MEICYLSTNSVDKTVSKLIVGRQNSRNMTNLLNRLKIVQEFNILIILRKSNTHQFWRLFNQKK